MFQGIAERSLPIQKKGKDPLSLCIALYCTAHCQTVFHWLAVLLSVLLYLGFGVTYNAVCYQCEGVTNPYQVLHSGVLHCTALHCTALLLQVIQHSLADPAQHLLLLLTGVLAILPR